MTPTDDQLREAARREVRHGECPAPSCQRPDITVEPNGTIWRNADGTVAFVTCVVAVPLGEVDG